MASAPSTTFSTSIVDGLRTLMRRLVRWPMQSTCGLSIAAQHPLGRVLVEARVDRGHHPVELLEHARRRRRARRWRGCSPRSPSGSGTAPARSFSASISSHCRSQPAVAQARRVVAHREVLVPERLRGARHLPRSSPCRPTRSSASAGRRAGRRARRATGSVAVARRRPARRCSRAARAGCTRSRGARRAPPRPRP